MKTKIWSMNENKVNSSRTVQVGCRVRPEVSEWLKTSGNVSDFVNEILEDRYENKVIVVNENMIVLKLNDGEIIDLKTLLNENPEYENIENIAKMALSKHVFNVLTYGLDENDERLLTPEREAEVKAQFQTLLDENMKSIKDENIQLVNENRKLQDEINVFMNRENVESISENIENNPVFIKLQNENKKLQDEINVFMNRENVENISENIENNPVFINLQNENKRLQNEINVFMNRENVENTFENMENNPVFMKLKSENIQLTKENQRLAIKNIEDNPIFINISHENQRLQDEINVFMNRENVKNIHENIEKNPVFIKIWDENRALKSENARLKTEDLDTVLAEITRFKLANQAGLDNMVNKAHDFMKKYSVKTVSTEKLKSYYIEAFENYEANTGNSDPR
ncbi:hypothetical protein [Flectobacillus rivi]|uniref:Uncharacterized protein n=1 Tax=Flectobacillus rivi TaxID=2984209 RepID=A0ABT6Z1S8_9BACT|nr:hypothetical protein [Flectobacillus rivi]MDI9874990.1 hypothetical protein [Flectobacillus rivi]